MRAVRARRAVAAFAVAVLALGATGCALFEALLDTEQALEDAGFGGASVDWESVNGVETVVVSWSADAETREGLDAESLGAAGVIWRVAPVRFDLVQAEPFVRFVEEDVFDPVRVYPRAQLEQEFGPRDPALDQEMSDLLNIRGIVTGIVVAVFVGLALIALIIVLVVRARPRAPTYAGGWPPPPTWPPQPPPGWPPPPAPPGWPPPPAPPGWPPQPPPDDPFRTPPGS